MQAAVAIVLLLNGVQVNLSAPALRVEGSACVPLRGICQRVGLAVQPEAGGRVVAVVGPGTHLRIGLGKPTPAGATLTGTRIAGTVYVPARGLAQSLGGSCAWDAQRLSLDLMIAWKGSTSSTTIPQLLGDAPYWRGRAVQVAGTIRRGRGSAGGGSWAVPGERSLLLGAGTGRLRVSRSADAGGSTAPDADGAKCIVRGTIGVLPGAEPWVGQAEAAMEAGSGASPSVEADRERAAPGDKVVVRVHSAGAARAPETGLSLLSPLGTVLGAEAMTWLRPGSEGVWQGRWTVPTPPGRGSPLPYQLRAAGSETQLQIDAEPSALHNLGGGEG